MKPNITDWLACSGSFWLVVLVATIFAARWAKDSERERYEDLLTALGIIALLTTFGTLLVEWLKGFR